MMVSSNGQLTTAQNHLGQRLNERLCRLDWPMDVSVGDFFDDFK